MPLIIVFTLKKDLQKSWVTLGDIQQQVNMSIPNSLMSAASEVLILLNLGVPTHRVLMASGSFATAFKPNALQDGDTLGSLPEFQFSMLEKINFVDHDTLPPGCVLLNGFSDPVLLDRLYEAITTCQEVSVDLIKALTDRMILPRLNLDRLHAVCVEFLSKRNIELVPEYKEALENLMRVAAQSNKSQEHIACRQKLDAIKAQFKDAKNPEVIAKHAAIHNLLQLMADYRANSNQFVLGSNRANRATVISATESDLLTQKLTLPSDTIFSVQECPILLEPGNACVLLTSIFNTNTTRKKCFEFSDDPKKMNAKMLDLFTGDHFINNAFLLGDHNMIVTPRIFCAEFGLFCNRNPFTNQPICAPIVLVKDVKILMQQLCRGFCASREMWHMLMAFASMLADHILQDEWAERAILLPYLNWLIDAIQTTKNFSDDASLPRVTLRSAIDYVLENYQVELRKFLPANALAMMKIPLTVTTSVKKDFAKIYSYLQVIDKFSNLLTDYKSGMTDPLDYIMERDPIDEHCIAPKKGVEAIIGMIFFEDSLPKNRKRFALKNKAFQDSLDLTLLMAKQSANKTLLALCRALEGENVDDVVPLCLPTIPNDKSHFGQENFDRTSTVNGKKHLVCGHCGFSRQVSTYDCSYEVTLSEQDKRARSDMLEHLIRAFTPEFFYNGFRCVKDACNELNITASEADLFKEAKKKLYAKHGKDFWALHTQHAKQKLLYFIRMRKYEAKLLIEKPIKE